MPESLSPAETNPGAPDEQVRLVCVMNEQGLHARPAAKLAQAAQRFEASITISMGTQQVDAKSILDILTLAAGHGSNLELRARGGDAGPAVEMLADMFKNRFQ